MWKSSFLFVKLLYANTHKHTQYVTSFLNTNLPSLAWYGKSIIFNVRCVVSRHQHVHISWWLITKKADNTLIVLFFFLIVLFSLSFFSRYKEIAGSLENAVSEGLAVAPGILYLGCQAKNNINTSHYTNSSLSLYVQPAAHSTWRSLRCCGPVL